MGPVAKGAILPRRRLSNAIRVPMKIHVRRAFTNAMLFVAAAVLIFEEWLWEQSKTLFARLARLPVIYSLEAWIRELPPYPALALFMLPILVIYPLKVLALFALGRGYVTSGIAAFVMAKLVATAVFARLYQLTEPALLQFSWIRHGRERFLAARAYIHRWLDAHPFFREAKARIRAKTEWLARRYRVAYRLQQRRPSSPKR
jgi:hypothetical protein